MVLAIVFLLVATVSVKIVRAARERHYISRQKRIEPLLEDFLSGGDVSGLRSLSYRDKDRYLAPLVVARVELLRGAERERVKTLARDLGLVDLYRRELTSRRRWQRAKATERLGYLGGAEDVPGISRLLGDEDETIRAVAARALARLGAPEALVRTLDTPSELTRLRVAENLDRMGHSAVPHLTALLEEAVVRGYDHPQGLVIACRVLGGLRAHEAKPALRRVVEAVDHQDVRAQAARALGMLGDTEDLPLLVGAAADGAWPVRVQAANALGMLGEPSTIPTLEELAGDREWWVRYSAATALANMGHAGEVALVALLDSPDSYARDRAAATLERRGITRRFVKQLPLDDTRGERARRAVRALAGLGITKYLGHLLGEMPDGAESRLLREILRVEPAREPARESREAG